MSKFISSRTSFKGGTISPKLFNRVDIREYQEALSIGNNALIGKHGGAYKRFGLRPIACITEDVNNRPSVKSLVLFGNKTLFFVFYPSSVRILDEEGRDISNGFVSLGGTYSVDDWSIAVFENTVITCHFSGTVRPKYFELSKNDAGVISVTGSYTANTDWYSTVPVRRGPPNIRLTVLGIAGGGDQIQSSAAHFTSDMVGERIMITGPTRIENGLRIATSTYRITGYVSSTLVNVVPDTTYTFGDTLSNLTWNNSNNSYQPSTTNSDAFEEWYQSVWSDRLGWPKTVAVDEGRVIFGGSPSYPSTIWGSMLNDPLFFLDRRYYNSSFSWIKITGSFIYRVDSQSFRHTYDGDILDLDPYQFTLSTKNGSEITFMEASTNFVVGTGNQEFIISGNGSIISQKNISARPHTTHGSFKLLSTSFDNTVLFVSRSKQAVHMFLYNEANGSYISKEVSILNDELLENRISSIAWHEELNVAFFVVAGKLVSLTLNNETQTTAFTSHDIDGFIYDIAYAVGEDDNKDYLAVLIERDGIIYLEKITRHDTDFLPFTFFGSEDKLSSLDGIRFLRQTENVKLYNMDKTNNYMHYDYSQLKVGDQVEFTSTNGSILSGTGLSLNTTYYVIPYLNVSQSGFRLALTLADAQSNTYIDFTGTGLVNFFDDGGIFVEITRNNQVIPTAHFPVGTEVTVLVPAVGGGLEELKFTVDGYTYDLGSPYVDVAYGLTYKFHIATTPIEAGQQWGPAQLGIKRIDKASTRVYNTRSYQIGTDGYNMEERIPSDGELFTGRDEVAVTGNPEYDHVIHIINEKAELCYVSGIVMRGVSNDG